jgi:phosphotriesterase-related protein
MTVTGLVEPSSLGITDAHNHLWIEPPQGAAPGGPILCNYAAIAAELQDYAAAGGKSQVDCQPGGCGRDGNRLRALSRHSGVMIVASTGFHLQRYYPPEAPIWAMKAGQALAYFLAEIRQGLEETRAEGPVYPGLIKIAMQASLEDTPLHLLEAAVGAALASGLALAVHTERGQGVEEFLELFLELGLPPQRLVFCHLDKRPDAGLHRELAQAGVLLEYDTFYRPKYHPEENLWRLLEDLGQGDLHTQVALATDLADGSLWRRIGGGPGIARFAADIPERLRSLALPEESITALTGGNIARRLASQ